MPDCPAGYTWLPEFGASCFKVTYQGGTSVASQIVDAEPTMTKICAQEGARLASVKTAAQLSALKRWAFGPDFTPTTTEQAVCILLQ